MKQSKKEKLFIETFEQWRLLLCMPPVQYENMDLEGDASAIEDNAEMLDSKNISIVQYDKKVLQQRHPSEITADALHELGHYFQRLPYETKEEKIISEYSAEKFAINVLKIFYPKYYTIKCKKMKAKMKDMEFWDKDRIYLSAYEKIEDYQ